MSTRRERAASRLAKVYLASLEELCRAEHKDQFLRALDQAHRAYDRIVSLVGERAARKVAAPAILEVVS